ncbi:hypothetical protein BJF85_03500 [Saccharomonospora sp. CUA-673]|nr:hypothetical protein BJF85_03500 [Saccharomonospora sp. CUA-673]
MTAMHGPVSPFPEPPSERACAGGEVAEPALPDTAARDRAARVVADRAEGEAYVASVCFKHGPPRLVGVELEHLVYDRADPSARLAPDRLARALGSHAPATLARHPGRTPGPSSAELPAGSALTVEPGGQVEISTAPHPTLDRLISAATTDLDHVAALLAAEGLLLGRTAIDSTRTPARLLETERYAAMERRFAARGSGGITMMCSTAAVQVCLDAGEPADLPARWAALHAAGPVLLALFANSTHHAGRRTGQRPRGGCRCWTPTRPAPDSTPNRPIRLRHGHAGCSTPR